MVSAGRMAAPGTLAGAYLDALLDVSQRRFTLREVLRFWQDNVGAEGYMVRQCRAASVSSTGIVAILSSCRCSQHAKPDRTSLGTTGPATFNRDPAWPEEEDLPYLTVIPTVDLLRELEPVAEQLLDRYLLMAKEWIPHNYVPWSLDRDFDTEPWTLNQPRLTGVAQAAFEVKLVT